MLRSTVDLLNIKRSSLLLMGCFRHLRETLPVCQNAFHSDLWPLSSFLSFHLKNPPSRLSERWPPWGWDESEVRASVADLQYFLLGGQWWWGVPAGCQGCSHSSMQFYRCMQSFHQCCMWREKESSSSLSSSCSFPCSVSPAFTSFPPTQLFHATVPSYF